MASYFTPYKFLSHRISFTSQLSPPPSSCAKTPPPSQSPTPPPSQSPTPPPSQTPPSQPSLSATPPPQQPTPKVLETSRKANVDSTDWVASSLTRRFGLGAGLAWAGFLAFGVVSEQIKTRLEVSEEQANTRVLEKEEEVVLPNGIRYYEMRVGGGATPRLGDLIVIDLKGSIKDSGEVFVDTFGKNYKPLVLVLGSRPYTRGMCEGIEYVLRTMKAGGKTRVIVPPNLGFGEDGADFGAGAQIPPNATLEYIVEVEKVSIAPA